MTAAQPPSAAAAAVDEERLWRRHQELARIGATEKGGVNRQALTPEEIESRRLLVSWARELERDGFTVEVTSAGSVRRGNDRGPSIL